MSEDAFMLSGDPQATQREEAERSGASSFRGILLLISELEYLSLVERLSRMALTERQLTTSKRLWTLSKGAVFGAIATALMLLSHICVSLLAGSFGWPTSVRILIMSGIFSGIIYGANDYLLSKLKFADGAAWTLRSLAMLGFIGHIFIVKFAMCMLPWFLRTMHVDVGFLVYKYVKEFYPYYAQLILPSGVEWVLFGVVVCSYVMSILRDRDVGTYLREIQNGQRPYDLLQSDS